MKEQSSGVWGELTSKALFRHPQSSLAMPFLWEFEYPWEALSSIEEFLIRLGKQLPATVYEQKAETVWVAGSASVAAGACITGPCILCPGVELRPGAFLRGATLVGEGAVVGNSTELKNCILFDGVQVPHYNYVGDSVLGYRAHL